MEDLRVELAVHEAREENERVALEWEGACSVMAWRHVRGGTGKLWYVQPGQKMTALRLRVGGG